ncbi:uncharacterized protein LOC142228327 isoform X3 [Haematobia irritans]|uniref:uncharacterized protein LOC142228327 isoform X3 n=1 Tax=Haematobia irritans TaxID=7368 RepID=UPI003F4FBFAD
MEVDDAIVMAEPPAALTAVAAVDNDKTVLGVEETGSERDTPTSSVVKPKRAKHKHDQEEPPGDKEKTESMVTATPIKLEVSGSEDEGNNDDVDGDDNGADGVTRAAIRRKLLSTPLEDDGMANDGLEEYEAASLKRKRYEVRRSGSEECLLGFDELSGEAELIKADEVQETTVEAEKPALVEVTSEVVKNSPRPNKKSPPQKTGKSPSQNAMRASSRSPKYQKAKSPAQESPSNKIAQKSPPKPHIVADAEEANGPQDIEMAPAVHTSTLVVSGKKPISPQDDFYKKPFEFGWKRELVWRANMEASKDKADVYFISPNGRKIRTRNDIMPLLEGDLTIDHFCFVREPLGASPDVEIVRSAKPSSRSSVTTATLAAAPSPPIVGKRVSKPKGPKGASPPPQGWTPSKALKVNNAALLSGTGGAGGAGRLSMSTQHHQPQHVATTPNSRKQDNTTAQISNSSKSSKLKKHANDIENDLKQINESIRKNRKQSNNNLEGGSYNAINSHNSQGASADHTNKLFATNFFANVSYAYDSLLCIMKYLKIHERPRAAAVCKLWNLAAKDTSLWRTVRMKNSKVSNWSGFAAALRRGETKHLDLRKMLQNNSRTEDPWNDFCENIGTVCSLESIYLCRCSARVVESLFQSNRNLRVINALAINDDSINLENIALLSSLEELRLRTCESGVLAGDLTPISALGKLTHLSLTSIKGLGEKSVEVLGELTTLKSLDLGECGDFDSTFAEAVLPKLINLQRLRLENGQVTNVCTLEILDAVARLVQLNQLELVNFDIKPGFDEKLSLCTNITKLLIIPTYISQSATTNQIVLSAVQQVSENLKVFTWCVTVELLRVTALYVDQCEESTKKEKHHFDECIPVLKPVPGAPAEDDEEETEIKTNNPDSSAGEEGNGDVPQIEILPLDKVETILAENLPHTKFTIVKVPYHLTSKQQLVD